MQQNPVMTEYHLRISGGPDRQKFKYGGFTLTQAQMTEVLGQVDEINVYKNCKNKCDTILVPDTASGASASAKKSTEDGAMTLHLEDFLTSLSVDQTSQFEEAVAKVLMDKESSSKSSKSGGSVKKSSGSVKKSSSKSSGSAKKPTKKVAGSAKKPSKKADTGSDKKEKASAKKSGSSAKKSAKKSSTASATKKKAGSAKRGRK